MLYKLWKSVAKTISHIIGDLSINFYHISPSFLDKIQEEVRSKMQSYVVDCMLGRLAKWMRILGLDTLYYRKMDDNELLSIALAEKRILVTRDRLLSKRKVLNGKVIFVESEDWKNQLKEFLFSCRCKDELRPFSRCSVCNHLLVRTNREGIDNKVPAFVLKENKDFLMCPFCKRIFWPGTHKEKIISVFTELGIDF